MAEVIPRWEWRTFARTIQTRIDIADFPRTRQAESSEIYLATATSVDNPKIRYGKLDIKALQTVNDHGLEQWSPVLKATFPLSEDEFSAVCRVLSLTNPPPAGQYSLDDLLRAIDHVADVWAVSAQKIRNLYDVAGCTVESSHVTFDGDTFRTVAAEDPDPVKVRDTVVRLGLADRENINYIKAIQRIKAGTLA